MLPTFCSQHELEWCWVQVVNAVVTRLMTEVLLVWQTSVLRGAQEVMNSFGTTCESQGRLCVSHCQQQLRGCGPTEACSTMHAQHQGMHLQGRDASDVQGPGLELSCRASILSLTPRDQGPFCWLEIGRSHA